MSEEKNLDLLDADQLLKLDLGKNVYAIFDLIESLRVDLNDAAVPDLDFYREKIQEARGYATTVREEIGKVLRARTRAQTRLTSRQNRWEITMSSMLETDDSVRGGTSIEDRKARAANKMVDLKNAIAASKTEVEALKNVKMALDISLRDFNSQCSDYKEQAKLVQEEGSRVRSLPPNGNYNTSEEEDELQKSLADVEDGYKVESSSADKEVAEGGLEVPDTWSDPEDETDEYENSVDSDAEDGEENGGDAREGTEDSADDLISDMMSGFSESEKDLDEKAKDAGLPDEEGLSSDSLDNDSDGEPEIELSLDEESLEKPSDGDLEKNEESMDEVGFGGLSLDGLDTDIEGDSEAELNLDGEPEEKSSDEDLGKDKKHNTHEEDDMELDFEDFAVEGVVTTDPKISKHFKEEETPEAKETEPAADTEKVVTSDNESEKTETPKPGKESSSLEEEDSIDSLLRDLGV